MNILNKDVRYKQLAQFFNISEDEAKLQLDKGFIYWHTKIAEDWNKYDTGTIQSIVDWYAQTEMYIWELSTYHLDYPPFGKHFEGMCKTINDHMSTYRGPGSAVMSLGEGIGDLAIYLTNIGWKMNYYDIPGRTMDFAKFNYSYWQKIIPNLNINFIESDGRSESLIGKYDIIIATDFFEHLPCVEDYLNKCYEILLPNGILIAYNAFGQGSPSRGNSIPQHLDCNNMYIDLFDNIMAKLGFKQLCSNVYKKVI